MPADSPADIPPANPGATPGAQAAPASPAPGEQVAPASPAPGERTLPGDALPALGTPPLANTTTECDVVIVGAGPAGCATGTFLARQGHHVIILDKETFPRDKVCGDGLTPRAVGAMQRLGLHAEAAGTLPGWTTQTGLRMYGGDVVWNLPWPTTEHYPNYSVTAARKVFDHRVAEHAIQSGATLWVGAKATEPIMDPANPDDCIGMTYQTSDKQTGHVRAKHVVLADGGSSRMAIQLGLLRDETRPMGTAVRAYYRSPRSTSTHMEGFMTIRAQGEILPAYGWMFPLDDGLINVGWGLISTSHHYGNTNYRKILTEWVSTLPEHWDINPGTQVGKPGSAPLPMGHNRHPHVYKGCVLVGDAGGMISPFNGEGISYAIEAGEMAAEAIDMALTRGNKRELEAYPAALAKAWGGYYRLGNTFLQVMGHPAIMRACVTHGMPRRYLMPFIQKTMAHLLNETKPKDVTDLIITTLARAVPAA